MQAQLSIRAAIAVLATTLLASPPSSRAQVLFDPVVNPGRVPVGSSTCESAVQGRIAGSGRSQTSWSRDDLTRLCSATPQSAEPARCLEQVMSGSVDWGGGTQWNPANALRLCAGASDAGERIACFEGRIGQGTAWGEAIDACAATQIGRKPAHVRLTDRVDQPTRTAALASYHRPLVRIRRDILPTGIVYDARGMNVFSP